MLQRTQLQRELRILRYERDVTWYHRCTESDCARMAGNRTRFTVISTELLLLMNTATADMHGLLKQLSQFVLVDFCEREASLTDTRDNL